jgi:hypothetical protein
MDRLGANVEPVVFVTSQRATAFDVASGKLLWSLTLGLTASKAPLRVQRYRDDWIVVQGNEMVVLDGIAGAIRVKLRLPFVARTLLAHDGYLVAAGDGGTACFRDGTMLWSSKHDWTNAEIVGPSGVTGRLPKFTHHAIAIGMGSHVAQAEEE